MYICHTEVSLFWANAVSPYPYRHISGDTKDVNNAAPIT